MPMQEAKQLPGVSSTQLSLLAAVYVFREKHPHGPTWTALAHEHGIGVSSVTPLMQGLRADGLVTYGDYRSTTVRVTDLGKQMLQTYRPDVFPADDEGLKNE